MNKAIFLDRDGVLNRETSAGYIWQVKDFDILPDVIETLQVLRDKGFIFVVVSNQSGVAKELYMRDDVERLHEVLRRTLSRNGIVLHEIYYCLHHSDHTKCLCRKPGTLFIEKAIARFNIDPDRSYFIGDKEHRDMQAARNADIKGILIRSNSSLKQILPYIG